MSISSTAERRITIKDEFWDWLYLSSSENIFSLALKILDIELIRVESVMDDPEYLISS